MGQFTAATAAPDQIEYLDSAAAVGRDYKQRFLDALDLSAGQVVLDTGCGPGTDLARLADAVTEEGSVIGVDHDSVMLDRARHRLADYANVDLRAGDAHALPLPDACVDRARADRVLQHLESPVRALAEFRRVLRPGGLLGLAEPDWDTLAIDSVDMETSRAFTRHTVANFRNPTMGRHLARLAVAAGFSLATVDVLPMVFRDVETAEQILGLRRNAARAVQAGYMTRPAAERWLDGLASGPFLAYFTLVIVVARA